MKSRFSDFIRSLDSGGEPSQASFDEFLTHLRGALRGEVRRRGLWERPPRYLGVVGGSWADKDAFEELVAGCCEFIVRKIPCLLRQSRVRTNIDGLIVLNIRHFLHTTQEKHDPVGTRVYRVVASAVKRLLDVGALHLLPASAEQDAEGASAGEFATDTEAGAETRAESGARIGRASVLGFTPRADSRLMPAVDLVERVEAWSAALLPDLVTAWHTKDVEARLEADVRRLREDAVEAFRFGDLLDCLRDSVRAWLGSAQRVAAGSLAYEGGDDELATVVRTAFPDQSLEERQSFTSMRRCVVQGLEALETSRKTRDYLLELWLFLHSYAAESSEVWDADEPPSTLKLSQLLGIPRNRIPGLKGTLGRLVRACQDATPAKEPVIDREEEPLGLGPPLASPSYAREDRSIGMSLKSRLERLRQEIGAAADRDVEARARIEGEPERPPRPGDTFVLARTAHVPVEWVVVERDPRNPRRLLMVPADDRPLIGSRDVEVDPEAGSGLTSLRCDRGVWLDERHLTSEVRSGALDPEIVERVRRKRSAIDSGTSTGSLLEQQVDGDPEYREWTERLAGAQKLLGGETVGEVRKFPGSSRWPPVERPLALAAVIVLGVGLGVIVTQYLKIQELERDSRGQEPQLDLPFRHFTGAVSVRGADTPLVVPPTARRVALILEVTEPEPYASYRLEVVEEGTGRRIWSSDELSRSASELSLDLPASILAPGSYLLRVSGLGETGAEPLEEYPLTIVSE